YKNLVIVNASEESRSVRAFDKLTGKQVWKQDADSLEQSYSTPAFTTVNGRTDLIMPVLGELWGLNPENGKLRWYATTRVTGNVAPSVVVNDDIIYLTGGFPSQITAAVRSGGKGDVTSTNILWQKQNASYVPSPVLFDGRLCVAT